MEDGPMASIDERTGNVLGRAFGRCLAEVGSLSAAYLPDGVSLPVAEAIVMEANRTRPADIPFAILVSEAEINVSDPQVPRLQARDLIRYRQGDRLAVVFGRVPEIASFVGAFREAMSQSFPDSPAAEVSLRTVARAAVAVLLDEVEAIPATSEIASEYLFGALNALERAYRGAPQGARSWNAAWFDHADRALGLLRDFLTTSIQDSPSMRIDEFFAAYSFAAFGLPHPNRGSSYGIPDNQLGRRFSDAFAGWWPDASTIAQTVGLLGRSTTSGAHALSAIDWGVFDEHLVVEDIHIAAWALTAVNGQSGLRPIADLSEKEFFNPVPPSVSGQPLTLRSAEGGMGLGQQPDVGPFILRSTLVGDRLVTDTVHITIPTIGLLDPEAIRRSGVAPRVASRGVKWIGELSLNEDELLEAVGHFEVEGTDPRVTATIHINLVIDEDDALFGAVIPVSSATAFLVPSTTHGLLAMKLNAKGIPAGKPVIVTPDFTTGDAGSGDLVGEYIDGMSRHRIVAWTVTAAAAMYEAQSMPILHNRTGLYALDLHPQQMDIYHVDGDEIAMRSPEPTQSFVSPLVAAAHKQQPSDGPLPTETLDSLRGRYEARSITDARTEAWLSASGHVVLASDGEESIDNAEGTEYGILMPPNTVASWRETVDSRVPQSLLRSAEAERFKAAFLHIDQTMDGELSADSRWPSRAMRAWLWRDARDELEEYLGAYVGLVEEARRGTDPFGVFWASYPFSISAWDLVTGECEAVYLSPLHPLRLAWLSGTESTLRDADRATELMGAIEGWAFPVIGPSETRSGRMVAVPSDNGIDQLFLGWSVLVRASTDRFQPLQAPSRIGASPAPGTTASGLNAAAVSAALRSYRRMNPHVAGITIDLAAARETARLREIDDAVVGAVRDWGRSDAHLIGGARILDATNRIGPAPLEGMTRLIRETPRLPLVWSRYEHVDGTPRTSNIRILQDSGARVCVYPADGANHGIVGQVPLRRFEAVDSSFDEPRTVSRMPGIGSSSGWQPFSEALNAVESFSGSPRVAAKLTSSLMTDAKADWTVSGESLLSPSAMAAILSETGNKRRMLWEWRPPVFAKSNGASLLERRPYVTIARVPQSFRVQLRELLTRAQGSEATEDDLDALLNRLGARGVGLSALLSMGGTHASGALGFSLGFSLMDSAAGGEHDRFVLPIDACDSFLMALAGSTKHAGAQQRADLLVIDMSDECLTLVPIEIKFYGLGAEVPNATLPGPQNALLDEPFRQLTSTMSLLRKIKERASDHPAGGRGASFDLWVNALASLVDAGARLQPAFASQPERYVERLQRILDGKIPLRIGNPLLAFFGHDARTAAGGEFNAFSGVRSSHDVPSGFGVLAANSAAAFAETPEKRGPMVEGWSQLLDWALGGETAGSTESSRPATRPAVSASSRGAAGSKVELDDRSIDQRSEELGAGADILKQRLAEQPGGQSTSNGIRFEVGEVLGSIGRGFATFWPSNTELNQMNVGVVGDLGVGKTQLLKSLVFNLRHEAKHGQKGPLSFLVFDYKRDFQDEDFVQAVGASILRPNRIPLNVFALRGGYTKLAANQRANMFCDVLDKIYGGVGPVQRNNLVEVISNLYQDAGGVAPTMAAVLDAYKQVVPRADAVVSILNTFVLGEVFSDDPAELVPFEQLIQDRVLVVALNDLGADQNGKNALVALFLNIYYDYMQASTKWPFEGSAPQLRTLNSFLLVDEAVNIMRYNFPVLMDIMLQGREFGFGTILASQYLGHFRNSQNNYGEPLLTWFIHKVPNVSDRELSQLGINGLPGGTGEKISRQGVHEALYRSLGFPGIFIKGTPFYQLLAQSGE